MVERVKLIAAQQELPLEPKVVRVKLTQLAPGEVFQAPAGTTRVDVELPAAGAAGTELVKTTSELKDALEHFFPKGAEDLAMPSAALSDWIQGPPPPRSGFWEYRIRGTTEQGTLWCTLGTVQHMDGEQVRQDGIWCQGGPQGSLVCLHSTVAGTMEYRGLAQPHPEGYLWDVPGARRARVKLGN